MSLGGQLLAAKDLDGVASLPTREQALAMLMGVMKAPTRSWWHARRDPANSCGRSLRCAIRSGGGGLIRLQVNLFQEKTMAVSKDEILDAIAKMSVSRWSS